MKNCRRLTISTLLRAVFCLVFVGFVQMDADAGLLQPIILVQPLGLSVQNGDTATISAVVTPSLTSKQYYYWYCGGKPVATNNNILSSIGLSGLDIVPTLTISNATAADAGTYTLAITNGGGGVVSSGATLIVLGSVSNIVTILSSGTGMTLNGFKLVLSGPTGSNYVVQASNDLKSWTPISTNSAPTGTVTFTDTSATNRPSRFYRAIVK